MNNQGYIKIHRKLLDNPVVFKDSETVAIWLYLLLNASHKEIDVLFKGKRITMKSGQLITGRNSIAKKLRCNSSKVQRTLKMFENEHQIEQQTSSKNRLITIVNWNTYQKSDKENEQQVNIKRTTSEHKQECKNVKNVRNNNIYIVEQIVDYLNSKTGSKYKSSTKNTQNKINARLNEGYTLDDFILVIDKKFLEWKGTEFEQYMRPETLFGSKFESYLNQPNKSKSKKPNWYGTDIKSTNATKQEIEELEKMISKI